MTIGNRISTLRKQMKYSQEYVAERLNVSRQAVSKWEKDISKPDTDNIIQLAELLNTNVDYILTGNIIPLTNNKEQKKKTSKQKKKILAWILSIIVFTVTVSTILLIHLCPVDWEAGACHGGYVTTIYDLYCDELTEKFVNGMDEKDKILWAEPIRGTQQGQDEGRKLFLQFDVKYKHSEHGEITHRLHFIGIRYWINSFKWSGAIIEG